MIRRREGRGETVWGGGCESQWETVALKRAVLVSQTTRRHNPEHRNI